MSHHDCVGDQLGRIEVHNISREPLLRGGSRADRVGDRDTLEQRVGQHGRRLSHEQTVGRRRKDSRRPGLTAAACRTLQRGPGADQIIDDDHCAIAHLAHQEFAGDDPAAAPLFDKRCRRLVMHFRRESSAELHDEPAAAFVEKRRSGGVVTGELLVGEVRDGAVIIFDDLISTGTTLQRAARRCREAGATRIFAAATHGLFMGKAPSVLADPLFEGIAVTDTVRSVAAVEQRLPGNIVHVDSSKLVADAIMVAHTGR